MRVLGKLRGRLPWPLVCWLIVVWVLLWGKVTAGNVLSGLVVGVLLCLAFPLPPLDLELRLHPAGIVRFAARFLFDLTVSGLRTVWQILSPGPLPCAVLAVPLRSRGDLMLTATAIAISAVPGSVVLELQRATGTVFVHFMGYGTGPAATEAHARADVQRLERLVVRAFGTRADIAALDGPDEPRDDPEGA
ncbi:Na+/H+ antiporter subunit E [Streptomyces sp. CA-111067]|uniref:Na+/H+ antiporter subunit E n=1 Tax=Streptomyces sp. CA-111067 TaxID=3240046 RepID=UPI003D964C6E